MTLEEHIYRILMAQGPCLMTDLYCIEDNMLRIIEAVDHLMSAGIADWVDDPEGRVGNVFIGLVQ